MLENIEPEDEVKQNQGKQIESLHIGRVRKKSGGRGGTLLVSSPGWLGGEVHSATLRFPDVVFVLGWVKSVVLIRRGNKQVFCAFLVNLFKFLLNCLFSRRRLIAHQWSLSPALDSSPAFLAQ